MSWCPVCPLCGEPPLFVLAGDVQAFCGTDNLNDANERFEEG
jgi:hypothetical protein